MFDYTDSLYNTIPNIYPMNEPITTTKLLDFLAKAHNFSSHVNVTKVEGGYKISAVADWYGDDHFMEQSTFITDEGEGKYKYGCEDFYEMNGDLNHIAKEQEEKEMKRQKRQELLSRLTDEEKELLGVN